jgi:hypothetical protein
MLAAPVPYLDLVSLEHLDHRFPRRSRTSDDLLAR